MTQEPSPLLNSGHAAGGANILIAIACAALPFLRFKPNSLSEAVLILAIGGGFLWLLFGPWLNPLKYHRRYIVRIISIATLVLLLFLANQSVLPWLLSTLAV